MKIVSQLNVVLSAVTSSNLKVCSILIIYEKKFIFFFSSFLRSSSKGPIIYASSYPIIHWLLSFDLLYVFDVRFMEFFSLVVGVVQPSSSTMHRCDAFGNTLAITNFNRYTQTVVIKNKLYFIIKEGLVVF